MKNQLLTHGEVSMPESPVEIQGEGVKRALATCYCVICEPLARQAFIFFCAAAAASNGIYICKGFSQQRL